MKILDISPLLSDRIGVFPGDTAFERHILMDTLKGDHLGLSWIKSTLHLGAHADAPNHYSKSDKGIADVPLDAYIGPCRVLRAQGLKANERVSWRHLSGRYADPHDVVGDQRLLVRTDTFTNPDRWSSDFAAFDPALLAHWAKSGVRLVGIDTPSVDLEKDPDLLAHQVLAQTGMAVLEGLVLGHVDEGLYDLVALPLKIEGADASPVRAILISGGERSWR